jgi:acetyltransferase
MSIYRFDKLFAPASVAVVGASPRAGSLGGIVLQSLRSSGYKGDVRAVNPKHREVFGVPCAPSLGALDPAPDLAVVAAPAEQVEIVIREAAEAGVCAAIILTAGLGAGEGSIAQSVRDIARKAGLRLVGPNCLGLMAPHMSLNASFAARLPNAGGLALISQSGAIAAGVAEWAIPRGIGFSGIISIGDAIDVDMADCLDWFAEDPATAAILVYIEAIRNARKFMSAARKAARVKPVIAIKAGRHESGARAAVTHTGALAGSDAVYDAALARAGCLRVIDLDEMFAAATTLAARPSFRGDKVGILTNGGGLGVLAADRLTDLGVALAPLSTTTRGALDAILPSTWSRANPVDIIGDAPPDRYRGALEALLADEGIDIVLALYCPTAIASGAAAADAVMAALRNGRDRTSKPVFAVWMGADVEQSQRFRLAGVAAYDSEGAASQGLAHAMRAHAIVEGLSDSHDEETLRIEPLRSEARDQIQGALSDDRDWLDPIEVSRLLAAYGIETPPTHLAAGPDEAARIASTMIDGASGWAVKIQSRDITHKSDVDGVRLGLKSPESVAAASREIIDRARTLRPTARIEGVTLQPMISWTQAREVIVGVTTDPTFGPVILFGQGGVAVEAVDDKALALLPIDRTGARRLIGRTRISRLLAAYRNIPAADTNAVVETMIRVSRMIEDNPEIIALDINPLLANAQGAIAIDARVQVKRPMPGQAPGLRFAVRPYPRDLEGRLKLRDEADLVVRPIRPGDAAAIMAMLERCTPHDLRMRFLVATSGPDPRLIARLCQIDYAREMAFVAIDPNSGEALCVARAFGDANHERAEFAIIVRSDRQGQGIGHGMMLRLLDFGRKEGWREMWGDVLASNGPMLALCRNVGFRIGASMSGEQQVRATIDVIRFAASQAV